MWRGEGKGKGEEGEDGKWEEGKNVGGEEEEDKEEEGK